MFDKKSHYFDDFFSSIKSKSSLNLLSHSKAILSENMFVSIVLKILIKDNLVSKKLEPHCITITPDMITFVRAPHNTRSF